MRRVLSLVVVVCVCAFPWHSASAQTTVLREGAESLVKAATKYFTRKGISESSEQLVKYGGREFAERVARSLVKEGGEEAVEKAAQLTAQYGPDVLRVIDNAPSPAALLKALDDIPADTMGSALARLGADGAGAPLQSLVQQYGSRMLRAEVTNPGVSVRLVRGLGDDGLELASKLGRDDAIAIARHADDIGHLPPEQKEGVLTLLYGDTRRMVEFMGRFIEKNPGSTLFYGAATTMVLANSERLLGGDELIIDKDGNAVIVSKPGLVGRTVDSFLDKIVTPILYVLLPIVAIGSAAWIAIKVYYSYRRERHRAGVAAQPTRPVAVEKPGGYLPEHHGGDMRAGTDGP